MGILPLKTIAKPEIKRWFTLLPNHDSPKESRFRCRICHENLNRFNIKPRRPSDIYTEAGYLAPDYNTNRKTILEHANTKYHQLVIADLIDEASGKSAGNYKTAQKRKSSQPHMESTINIIRTVYAHTKLNMPFSSYPALVALQEINGASMGDALHTHKDCKKIMTFMSREMWAIWKRETMIVDRPLTMIVGRILI